MCTQKIAAGNNHVKLYSRSVRDEPKQPGMSIFRWNKMGVVLTKQLYKFPRASKHLCQKLIGHGPPTETYPKCHKPQPGILKN